MIEDDLSAFFVVGEFASECLRTRPGAVDAAFAGVFCHTDDDALDGHAISGTHRLEYATEAVELLAGDRVTCGALTYEVRRVDRVNDGRESVATLRLPQEP